MSTSNEQPTPETAAAPAAAPASSNADALGTAPLGKLMLTLSIPSIVAQLANLLYNVIDRVFIGHVEGIGADALTGLGVCMPIIVLTLAFSLFAAGGGAPLASMELGAGNQRRAQEVMLQVETLLFILGIVLMAVTYLFMEPLLMLFGGSAATIGYAADYLYIYMLSTFFAMISMGIGLFLLAQGQSVPMLIAQVVGAIVHAALAAVLIFILGWGVRGAAIASVVSQGLCAWIIVYYLRKPTSVLRFEFRLVPLNGALIRRILSIGSGRFFIMASESLLLIVVNASLQNYGGDAYVGAMTVLYALQNMVCAFIQGFTQATQPIISYCYGARLIARCQLAIRRIIIVTTLVCFALSCLIMAFPRECASFFTDDPALLDIVVANSFVYFVGFSVFGIQLGMQTTFMGLGKGFCSLAVAAVRKAVMFIPLVLILPHFFGVVGVIWAEPISDVVSVLFCASLFFAVVPRTLRDVR